jgi:hypothetical protein
LQVCLDAIQAKRDSVSRIEEQAMKKIMTTQVGADGILTLTVPLAKSDANKIVRVTLETVDDAGVSKGTPEGREEREEWLRFVERTAGTIKDPTFERQPQGEFEERDRLP